MTDHVVLKHWVMNGETIPPLSWWGNPPDMKCANGHIGGLSDHTIAPDGTVMPSIVCNEPTCGWHVWGRLEGYPQVRKIKERDA